MTYDNMREFAINIAILTASEFEFSDFEHEAGTHCNHIRHVVKKILVRLQDDKYEGKYNLSEEDIEKISFLSMFHDIGKCKVPGDIVHNPGKLTEEEFEQMKKHTIYGAEIVLRYKDVIQDKKMISYLYDICRSHHEKWDGTGYPSRLKGDDIPFWAQVVGIVDCYDVLISTRSYKKAIDKQLAVKCIRQGKCGTFNPDILEAFLQSVETELQNVSQFKI